MPELPEVETTLRGIEKKVLNWLRAKKLTTPLGAANT